MPRRSTPFVLALCLMIAAPASAKMERPGLRAGPEAVQRAREWAATMLPTAAQLGDDWRYQWQLPAGHRELTASEDTYWQRAGSRMGLVAMNEQEARDAIDTAAGEIAMLGVSRREALAVMLVMFSNVRPVDALALRLKLAGEGMADAAGGNPMLAMRQVFAELIKPYEGVAEEQLHDAIVEQVMRVKRATMMEYYLSDDWEKAASDTPGGAWIGKATVTTAQIDDDWVNGIEKVDAAAAERHAAALTESLRAADAGRQKLAPAMTGERAAQMQMALQMLEQQIANAPNEQARRQMIAARDMAKQQIAAMGGAGPADGADDSRVTVRVLNLGDDAYVLRVESPAAGLLGFQQATGWVRQGDTITIVELTGDVPDDRIADVVEHVLKAVAAR